MTGTSPTITNLTARAKLLGTGLAFPFSFTPYGRTEDSAGLLHVRHSILRILFTPRLSQFMRREFGTDLHSLVFENNDQRLRALVPAMVKEALARWEPRVYHTRVETLFSETVPNLLWVRVSYRIISTQVDDNLVFPFYTRLPLSAAEAATEVRR